MTTSARRAALLVLIGLALATSATGAAARENETFGLTPFPEERRGVSRLGFEIPREPGAVFEDAVKIYNRTNEALLLNVYAADVEETADENINVRFGNQATVGVGDWIDLARDRVSLSPRGEVIVTFRVNVKTAEPSPNLGAIVVENAARGLASAQRLYLVVRTAPADASTTSVRVRPIVLQSPWVIVAILGLVVAVALVWIGTRRARRSKDVLVPAGEIEPPTEKVAVAPEASRPVLKRLGEPDAPAALTAVLERSTRPLPASGNDDRPLLDDAFLVEVDAPADEDEPEEDGDEGVDRLLDEEDDLPPARHRESRPRARTSASGRTQRARNRNVSAQKRKTSRPAPKQSVARGKRRANAQARKRDTSARSPKKNYIPLDDL